MTGSVDCLKFLASIGGGLLDVGPITEVEEAEAEVEENEAEAEEAGAEAEEAEVEAEEEAEACYSIHYTFHTRMYIHIARCLKPLVFLSSFGFLEL